MQWFGNNNWLTFWEKKNNTFDFELSVKYTDPTKERALEIENKDYMLNLATMPNANFIELYRNTTLTLFYNAWRRHNHKSQIVKRPVDGTFPRFQSYGRADCRVNADENQSQSKNPVFVWAGHARAGKSFSGECLDEQFSGVAWIFEPKIKDFWSIGAACCYLPSSWSFNSDFNILKLSSEILLSVGCSRRIVCRIRCSVV